MNIKYLRLLVVLFVFSSPVVSSDLIINVDGRTTQSLNGKWNIIVDPYQIGYYDYRYQPSRNGFFRNAKPRNKSELVEYSFDSDAMLQVPGDWNSQDRMFFLYEGTIWYRTSFEYDLKRNRRLFLYFAAVNYQAKVFVNGEPAYEHEGGFTPFNCEITEMVREENNDIIVMVDNKRFREAVPTVNTDWFNYGGITRRVLLIETPKTFIRDYVVQLKKGTRNTVSGWVQLDGPDRETVTLSIPEVEVERQLNPDANGFATFSFQQNFELWRPEHPKLYDVILKTHDEEVTDRIGFRSIEVQGTDILLNGKPVYLRGICLHEEKPFGGGARAFAPEHARTLLGWAKELNCNFVRLAHYPHNEYMTRVADEMGILVWSEIPVYWTILWDNDGTYQNARRQLTEMITRDRNKASVILWSMANETPLSDERLAFLNGLVDHARQLDPTRLITAAMEKHYEGRNTVVIDDPFGKYVDVLGCNEYIGWYDGLPEKCRRVDWTCAYNKPVIVSEFGGGALYGDHGDTLTRWSEEFQNSIYAETTTMLDKVPFVKGMSPWILKDFRSPRRQLPRIQDFWNRKGLISDEGQKKQAFYTLKAYYQKKEAQAQ